MVGRHLGCKAFRGSWITLLLKKLQLYRRFYRLHDTNPATCLWPWCELHQGSICVWPDIFPNKTFKQPWTETDDPTIDGWIIQINAAFRHHFSQIAEALIVSKVLSNIEQNDGLIEVVTFEQQKYSAHWKPGYYQFIHWRNICSKTVNHGSKLYVVSFQP